MPLFYQQDINETTKLGVWRITEQEGFFLAEVPLHRDITHPHKRLQHLAGRFLLKWLFPDFPYNLIRIADTRKPFLSNEAYHFSISHCGEFAAALVSSTHRVGVDVELATPKVHKVLHKFLNREEEWLLEKMQNHQRFAGISPDPFLMATLLWSAKESVFKWYGKGNVDFSENILLSEYTGGEAGRLNGFFSRGNQVPITVGYRIFENLCLSWVCNDYTE